MLVDHNAVYHLEPHARSFSYIFGSKKWLEDPRTYLFRNSRPVVDNAYLCKFPVPLSLNGQRSIGNAFQRIYCIIDQVGPYLVQFAYQNQYRWQAEVKVLN